jgi:hypothetical protein
MSGWVAYLTEVGYVASDSAIISLQGAQCGVAGKWAATSAEEVAYSNLLKDIGSAQAKGLTYAGKKFIITRAVDDTILAQLGKEGLVLQKSLNVLVGAHYTEGQVVGQVAGKVAKVVTQLSANNI